MNGDGIEQKTTKVEPSDFSISAYVNHATPSSSALVRGIGRTAAVVNFESAVVGYFVEAADVLGVPKSVAAIYGICFASPEPLSYSEINERLDISAGSVSQGLRVLKEVGALKTVGSDGAVIGSTPLSVIGGKTRSATAGGSAAANDRSEAQNTNNEQLITTNGVARAARGTYYAPDLELRNLVLHWIETRLQKQLKSGEDRVDAILASIPAGAPGEALRERMEHLQSWQSKARALMPVVKTFLKLG